jgi:hypothetical protein
LKLNYMICVSHAALIVHYMRRSRPQPQTSNAGGRVVGLAIPNWAGLGDWGQGVAHLDVLDKNNIFVHPSRWGMRYMLWEMVENLFLGAVLGYPNAH